MSDGRRPREHPWASNRACCAPSGRGRPSSAPPPRAPRTPRPGRRSEEPPSSGKPSTSFTTVQEQGGRFFAVFDLSAGTRGWPLASRRRPTPPVDKWTLSCATLVSRRSPSSAAALPRARPAQRPSGGLGSLCPSLSALPPAPAVVQTSSSPLAATWEPRRVRRARGALLWDTCSASKQRSQRVRSP